MESKCLHCGKLPSDPINNFPFTVGQFKGLSHATVAPFDFFTIGFQKQGCYSSGFCHNCNIFYWDSTCMCMGKTCYKCGNHVGGGTSCKEKLPDGIYEYRCWHTTEMREYKDGSLGKTISKSRLPGNEWMDEK